MQWLILSDSSELSPCEAANISKSQIDAHSYASGGQALTSNLLPGPWHHSPNWQKMPE